MKPASFAYHRARDVADALAAMAASDDAVFLSGGQSLVPMLNLRLAQPALLIDLNDCTELSGIRRIGADLVIGALTRHHALASDPAVQNGNPLLAHAAGTIGYYPIRQRGTLGGSLAHADPAAQLPLIAMLLAADIDLRGPGGARTVAADDFFLSVFTTAREPDEMITSARLPCLAPAEGWGFTELTRVAGDFAIASAAATIRRDVTGRIGAARLAVGAVCDVPVRIDCAALDGTSGDAATLEAFAQQAAADLAIEDTARLDADARRDLAAAMIGQALAQAMQRAGATP